MHQYVRTSSILLFFLLLAVSACRAQITEAPLQDYAFTTVELPGGIPCIPNDISSSGDMTGVYLDDEGNVRSFLLDSEGNLTPIDFPGATATFAGGINDSGQVAGDYMDTNGNYHGFLYSDGEYQAIDVPQATATFVTDINNSGEIVGIYDDTSQKRHGFILSDGEFSTIDFPEAGITTVNGINDFDALTVIAKATVVPAEREEPFITDIQTYILSDGEFIASIDTSRTGISPPICGYGINNSRTIVGQYFEFDSESGVDFDHPRGYVVIEGNVTPLDFPSAMATGPVGINDAGQIVGFYDDAEGNRRGFRADPVVSR